MASCNKTSNRCQTKNFAACIEYQGNLSDNTTIQDECYNLEEVIQDITSLLDTTILNTNCNNLEYCENTLPQNKTVKNILQFVLDELCSIKSRLNEYDTLFETINQQITDLQTNNCP